MPPHLIRIPKWVDEESFPRLLALLNTGNGHAAVEISIADVRFLTPAAVVAILARCNRWRREGAEIILSGEESCENLGYLQRIDFLSHLGIEIPETFIRRDPSGRFVPVQTLNFAVGSVDQIASEITRCTLPDSSPWDDVYLMLQYAAGELLSNAKYHSCGRAFVCAQFFPARNQVRIAVADDGMGIRGSFLNTSREAEADKALWLSCERRVRSGKSFQEGCHLVCLFAPRFMQSVHSDSRAGLETRGAFYEFIRHCIGSGFRFGPVLSRRRRDSQRWKGGPSCKPD